MEALDRPMPELELALLRRSVDAIGATLERCGRCQRRPLVGERVYPDPRLGLLCELCSKPDGARGEPRRVHGPEFGHTLRLLHQRPAA